MADKNRSNKKRFRILMSICVMLLCGGIGCYILVKYAFTAREGLSDDSLIIYEGHTKELTLYNENNRNVLWNSSDESVAVVTEAGEVTAVSEGEAQIVVQLGKKSYRCQVTVKKPLSPVYYGKVEAEREWILRQRLNNGLLANRLDEDSTVLLVNPYFSSVIANAIVECTSDDTELEYVRNYLDWYFERMNKEADYNGLVGTIYDYGEILNEGGEVVSEYPYGQYDSVDSYAALFIIALYHYYDKTGDLAYVKEHEEELGLIVDVMTDTFCDNYSITKPDYPLQYLMDNSEVYEGLRCAEQLYGEVIPDYDRRDRAERLRKNMKECFDDTWWQDGHYSTWLDENNADVSEFSWEVFYPDAVSQLYPVIYGLADEDYAKKIYEEFCKRYEWEHMDYFLQGDVDYYWGVVCYAAVIMGDVDRAQEYIERYETMTQGREYPLIASDSAWVMLAEYRLAQYYEYLENQ